MSDEDTPRMNLPWFRPGDEAPKQAMSVEVRTVKLNLVRKSD